MFSWVPRRYHGCMSVRQIAAAVALLMVLCTVSLFLFQASTGPYSATHGPVTAMRPVRARLILDFAMISAAYVRLLGVFSVLMPAGFVSSLNLPLADLSLQDNPVWRC